MFTQFLFLSHWFIRFTLWTIDLQCVLIYFIFVVIKTFLEFYNFVVDWNKCESKKRVFLYLYINVFIIVFCCYSFLYNYYYFIIILLFIIYLHRTKFYLIWICCVNGKRRKRKMCVVSRLARTLDCCIDERKSYFLLEPAAALLLLLLHARQELHCRRIVQTMAWSGVITTTNLHNNDLPCRAAGLLFSYSLERQWLYVFFFIFF